MLMASSRGCQKVNIVNDVVQKARQIFDKAVSSDDAETNEKGEIALHGVTVAAWTTKIP